MEPIAQNKPYQFGAVPSPARDTSGDGETIAGKVSNAAQAVREQVGERAAEKIDQAKQKVSEFYNQANKSLNEKYDKAVDYSHENPGKTTLIIFGAGAGVGWLLLSNLRGSRSRRGRVVEPVMNAISTLASELFR